MTDQLLDESVHRTLWRLIRLSISLVAPIVLGNPPLHNPLTTPKEIYKREAQDKHVLSWTVQLYSPTVRITAAGTMYSGFFDPEMNVAWGQCSLDCAAISYCSRSSNSVRTKPRIWSESPYVEFPFICSRVKYKDMHLCSLHAPHCGGSVLSQRNSKPHS